MKKHLRKAVALGLAFATVGASSVFAAHSMKLTGSIGEMTMNVSLPSSGSLTINPFAKTQIAAGFMDGSTERDFIAVQNSGKISKGDVAYKISIAGYTVTAVSKGGEDDPITIKNNNNAKTELSAYTGTGKQVSIQLGVAAENPDDNGTGVALSKISKAADFDTKYAANIDDGQTVLVTGLSEADYDANNAESAYTAVSAAEAAKGATVQPGGNFMFKVDGTMNPAAEWKEGDSLSITPVFTVIPDVVNTFTMT